MKKYRYMVAIACVLAGAAGFAGIFAMEQLDSNKKELTKNEQIEQIQQVESTEELGNNQNIAGTDLLAQREDKISKNTEQTEQEKIIPVEDAEIAKNQTNQTQEPKQETAQEPIAANSTENEENLQENVASVETISPEVLHFEAENGIIWPIEGTVLLDYSMDSSIYFPTLQQYQYNPAMVIQGEVNSKVYFVARGKITNIENNEEKYGNIQYEESVLQLTKADKARETADEFLTEKYTIENEEYKIFSSFSVTYEHKVEDKNNIISLKFGLSSKLKGEYHLDIQMYGVKDNKEYPLVGYYNLSNNILSSYSQNATVSDKLNFDYIYVKATVLDLNGITHEIFYKQAFADLEKK